MSWSLLAAVAAFILLPVLLHIWSRHGRRILRNPYQKRTHLFSSDDRVFHHALKAAMGEQFEIFAKIPVGAIILPKKHLTRTQARHRFDPLTGRVFDFVLCDRKNLAVQCVIMLYDKTNPERRTEPDDSLKRICESVSLPFAVFHIKADYTLEEIRERLRQAMTQEPFYLLENSGRKEPRISNLKDIKL